MMTILGALFCAVGGFFVGAGYVVCHKAARQSGIVLLFAGAGFTLLGLVLR